jgi:hypothetical protein
VFDPISPTYPRHTAREQLARSLGPVFATYLCTPYFPRLGAFALSPRPGVPSFPVFRLLCPNRLLMRHWSFVGLSLASFPPSLASVMRSPVFPMEDSSKTMEVAHCQRSHPLSAAPQTEHGVKAGSPMHSSTGPTGSPRVELPAVGMTGSVGLAGIRGKVCQGHSSPKDDRRFL